MWYMYRILSVVGWYWTAFVALYLAIRMIPWRRRSRGGLATGSGDPAPEALTGADVR